MSKDIFHDLIDLVSKFLDPAESEAIVESLCARVMLFPEDLQPTDLPTILIAFCSNDDILDAFEPQAFADLMDVLIAYSSPKYVDGLCSPWDLLGDEEENSDVQKKVWDAYNTQKDQANMLIQSIRNLVDEIVKSRTMELQLSDSELKFHRMLEISPETTLIHIKGRVVYANPASLKLFKTDDSNKLIDKPVMELIQTSDQGSQGELVSDRIIAFDGRYVDVEVTASPTTYEGKSAAQLVIKNITDKVRAQRALLESESRYRILAENIADVIWTMDMDLNFTYISPSVMRLRGFTVEKALAQRIEDVLPPGSLEKATKFFMEELDRDQSSRKYDDKVRTIELEQFHKNGSIVKTEVRITGLRSMEGEVIGILGVTRDVTDRKKAEEKLAASETRFRRLFDKMLEGVYRSTPKGKILSANPALVEMLGYKTFDELKKVNISKYLYIEPKERKKYIKQLEETGELRNLELRLKRKNGEELVVLENAHLVKDKKGKVRYYEGTLTDVTGFKQVDKQLRMSEEQYKRLFDNMVEGVFQTTPDGKVLSANKAMVKMLGYKSIKELKKIDIAEDLYANPNERKTFIRRLGKDGVLKNYDIDMKHSDGSVITVRENVTAVRDPKGRVKYYEGTMEDISGEKQAEEALRQSEDLNRGILDNVGIGIAVLDKDMHLLSINNQIKKWFPKIDMKKNPVCYKAYKDPPAKKRCSYCPSHKTFKDGKPHEAVSETETNGKVKNFRIASSPLKDKSGKVTAVIELIEDITEEKNIQKALEVSEQRLRRLVESLGDGVCIADSDETFIFVNPAAEEIFGVKKGKLMGANLKDFVSPQTYRQIKEQTKKRRKGEAGVYDIEIIQPGGGKRTIIVNATPRYDDEGDFTSSFGIFTDITERRQMEADLTESQDQYKELVERADIAIIIDDNKGDYIYYNQKFLDLYGYSDKDMKKTRVEKLVHPDDRERMMKIHKDRIKNKKAPERYRFKGIRKTGEPFWVEVDAVERIVDGKMAGTRAYLRDITEQVEMELKYKDLVEMAGIAIIQDDARNKIVYYNKKFLELYGYTAKEMEKLTRKDLVHPEDYRTVVGHHNARVKGKRTPSRYRFRGRRKSGEIIRIEVDVTPIVDNDKVLGTRAYLKDITEIYEMEQAVKQSEEMFKDLVEKAGIAIVIDTKDGGFEYINQKFLDIFGYTDKDIRNLGIGDLVHPDDGKKVMKRHKDRTQGKKVPSRYRFRGVKKNGETVYLELEAVIITKGGKITGTRSYIWDISRRMKVEESIKKHQAMLDSMRGVEKELKKGEKKKGGTSSSKKAGGTKKNKGSKKKGSKK